MGHGLETLTSALGWLQERCRWAYWLANVVSCSVMIGCAVFDPISATEGHRYCDVAGCYTGPPGLVLLLVIIIPAGPFRTDLVAWLPLYLATLSLVTASVAHIMDWPPAATDRSADRIDLENQDDTEPDVEGRGGPPSPAVVRWMSELPSRYVFGLDHDHSRLVSYSDRRSGTTMSLSSTPGHARPSWGWRVLGFWLDPLALALGRQRPPPRRLSHDSLDEPLDPYHDDVAPADQEP
ncbi:hypothetical protein M406DRAFT_327502 [Cryphonectria parasitica EP155]|uniref:Uncharacterized protein n=1 Tax=Cryphonectria parasitica (strain ATCC 38755 / EP155) TaxID=660469 RepID=A0A9P4Y990_CRYP1|nr:uncharacterized protein M406DRAFT_327502 [Cryphonectria parasitica EP155]KAF3769096.1 hypothetical protein M406DRAFT_327502 [Cryphonectria parasitica EP155]